MLLALNKDFTHLQLTLLLVSRALVVVWFERGLFTSHQRDLLVV